MTIGAALTKLGKYAKVFGSEKVGGYMAAFVDRVILHYLAEEFREATAELDKLRDHLQLTDECCEQVLQSDMFSRAVTSKGQVNKTSKSISWQAHSRSMTQMVPGYS
jgi:hypothetical protein